jgi:uncharacterized protein (TIGR02145 family)
MRYITDILSEIDTWCHPGEPIDINYGILYNWYAATDARNICSVGWHLPSNTEFLTLMLYLDPIGLGNNNTAGGQLKEIGLTYWNTPNTNATNLALFNGRGTGFRNGVTGIYFNFKNTGPLWTSTQYSPNYADDVFFVYNSGIFWITYGVTTVNSIESAGFSIRPIKDSTILSHGEEGTYIDPSGYIYRTICIGSQEWVADNIITRHYRNGNAIPEVTDNVTWAALITGAMCYYNNDSSFI